MNIIHDAPAKRVSLLRQMTEQRLALVPLAGTILVVTGYQLWIQLVANRARPLSLFWLDLLLFGVLGPVLAWVLLRRAQKHAQAEAAARRRIDALLVQEYYLARVVASSADAIIGLDVDGRIVAWNHGAEAMFGYSLAEAQGKSPTFVLGGDERGEQEWERVQQQVSDAGVPSSDELTAWHQDGRPIPVEFTYAPVRDDSGRILGSAAVLRDVSQRKALEAEELRRNRELEALYAVSAAMSTAVSVDRALPDALNSVLEVLELESGKIYLFDQEGQHLILAAAQGNPTLLDPAEISIGGDECLCGRAAQSGEALLVEDVINDPRIIRSECLRHGRRACAAVPLPAKDRILGVMHVTARSDGTLSGPNMVLLRSIGAQIGVAVENLRLREEARRAEALSTLIQEMHHRIKNNLQTVADLLSLEMSGSTSPDARKSLRDSINRIKSIAAVHQLLSLEQLRLTNITELARQVCNLALHQMVGPGQQIETVVEGPDIYLPSKQATALALVMNELVTNAIEHAFAARGTRPAQHACGARRRTGTGDRYGRRTRAARRLRPGEKRRARSADRAHAGREGSGRRLAA